jgi:hypothetical protein
VNTASLAETRSVGGLASRWRHMNAVLHHIG